MHEVAGWLNWFLDWPDTLIRSAGALPPWALVLLIFIPSIAAVGTGSLEVILPVLVLNALIAISAFSWPAGELRLVSTALATALILWLVSHALRRAARDRAAAQRDARLQQLEGRVGVFLDALDRRSQIVEEGAIEMAKRRLKAETAESRRPGQGQENPPKPPDR
jgi:membrane protein implicated in regulation of membrane protease activity